MLKESKELIRIVIETVAHTKYLPDNLEVDLEDYCDKYQKKTYTFETIVDGIDIPWGMTWLPDGTMLVTEKSGKLYHVKNKTKSEIFN